MNNKQENIRLLVSLGLAGLMVGAILLVVRQFSPNIRGEIQSPSSPSDPSSSLSTSLGEKILVKVQTYPEKEAGVAAFVKQDFTTAIEKFSTSQKKNPNDPETLIYLNNAKIAQNKSPSLKVAVIAPINFDIKLAEETLRGVAQAQDEVNTSGGINGKKLQILIVTSNRSGGNNSNSSTNSEQLDNELIKDNSLLGVVGSRRKSSIYNDKHLVLVFPVEPARDSGNPDNSAQAVNNQSEPAESNYVFYVNSSDVLIDTHARQIVRESRNIAICGDSSLGNNSTNTRSNSAASFNKIFEIL